MRIASQDTTPNARRPEHTGRSTEAARTRASEGIDHTSEVATLDKVELSSQARDIRRAREVAQAAPEVRAERVEAARRALQNGTLNLNGKDLAGKLLRDTLPS
jgi:flagellar biosynthesis anti-sigma factor FlgM